MTEKLDKLKEAVANAELVPSKKDKDLFSQITQRIELVTSTWDKKDRQAAQETALQLYNMAKDDPEMFSVVQSNPTKTLQLFVKAASLKLNGSPESLFYFVRMGGTLNLWVSYKGLIELAYRAGLQSIQARAVHETDEFQVDYGFEDVLIHRPNLHKDRGKIIGFYAKAKINDCNVSEYMSVEDLQNFKKKFSRLDKQGGNRFWDQNFEEMSKKTVVRRLLKYAPKLRKLDLSEDDAEDFTSSESLRVVSSEQPLELAQAEAL